jgi:hypothetical protein
MSANFFPVLDDPFDFRHVAFIREYSCSFVADTPFLNKPCDTGAAPAPQ